MSTATEAYARTSSRPYFCMWCMKRSPFPIPHRTLGLICQHCLRPFGPVTKPRAAAGSSQAAPAKARKRVSRRAVSRHVRQWSEPLRKLGERDNWICWLCGEKVDPLGPWPHRPSADHLKLRRDGGKRDPDNLRLAHQSCNEYRDGAKVTPFAPPLATER